MVLNSVSVQVLSQNQGSPYSCGQTFSLKGLFSSGRMWTWIVRSSLVHVQDTSLFPSVMFEAVYDQNKNQSERECFKLISKDASRCSACKILYIRYIYSTTGIYSWNYIVPDTSSSCKKSCKHVRSSSQCPHVSLTVVGSSSEHTVQSKLYMLTGNYRSDCSWLVNIYFEDVPRNKLQDLGSPGSHRPTLCGFSYSNDVSSSVSSEDSIPLHVSTASTCRGITSLRGNTSALASLQSAVSVQVERVCLWTKQEQYQLHSHAAVWAAGRPTHTN